MGGGIVALADVATVTAADRQPMARAIAAAAAEAAVNVRASPHTTHPTGCSREQVCALRVCAWTVAVTAPVAVTTACYVNGIMLDQQPEL